MVIDICLLISGKHRISSNVIVSLHQNLYLSYKAFEHENHYLPSKICSVVFLNNTVTAHTLQYFKEPLIVGMNMLLSFLQEIQSETIFEDCN